MPRELLYVLATDDFCLSVCLRADLASFYLSHEKDGPNERCFLQLGHGFLRNIPLGMKFCLVGFTP